MDYKKFTSIQLKGIFYVQYCIHLRVEYEGWYNWLW